MLETKTDPLVATEIEQEGKNIDVDDPTSEDGNEGDTDEAGDPLVIAVGEQGQPHVGEDKVLREEVDQFQDFFCASSRLFTEVDVSVVGLHNATEQHCNNT